MPTALTQNVINSLGEFTDFIEDALRHAEGTAWYRGVGVAEYRLVPSLYRHPEKRAMDDLREIEGEIINRFKQRCVPYLSRPLGDEWDHLFLMQHFGVPTRLLDWTENPYIALYFALTTTPRDEATGEYTADAAVWSLAPIRWNAHALQHLRVSSILSPNDSRLDGYAPGVEMRLMNSEPVAIYGTHNSPRIVAQRGAFTIFGRNVEPLEDTYAVREFPQDCLTKVVLPREHIPLLLQSLVRIGFSDSVVFPDLDGLAKELKRFYGFRV